jgi:flavin-binding protein dodecin
MLTRSMHKGVVMGRQDLWFLVLALVVLVAAGCAVPRDPRGTLGQGAGECCHYRKTGRRGYNGGQEMAAARFEDAINEAVARATKTLRGVEGAWVKDMNVSIEDGNIKRYRVNLEITFRLENPS